MSLTGAQLGGIITLFSTGTSGTSGVVESDLTFNSGGKLLTVSGSIDVYSGIRLIPNTTPPLVQAGMIYYDSDDSHFYGYNGTVWKQLDN